MNNLIANIANTSAVAGLAIGGYIYISDLRADFSDAQTQLEKMESQIERFEELKVEIENAAVKFSEQDQAIAEVERKAAVAVSQTTADINARISRLEEKKESTGVTVIKTDCLPQNEILLVEPGRSYDFCNSDWVLQISRISDNSLVIKSNGLKVPFTYEGRGHLVPQNCTFEGREIVESGRKAKIRGRCS